MQQLMHAKAKHKMTLFRYSMISHVQFVSPEARTWHQLPCTFFDADTETRALRDQLHLQHTACTAAIQDALPILGAYGDGGSLRLPAASARQCVASSGSLLPSPASREEALQRPLLGLVKMDTLQVAAETWRLHPFFDSVQWSQSCDVLAALLRGLGSPQAAALPQALASFPELLQSVSPADFGQEFKADSAGSAAES